MTAVSIALAARLSEGSTHPNMVWVPGGTFRMGSEKHYPEEAPVHRVAVSGFWIDRTPVTNRQFKEFVRATGHKTFAEIPPDRAPCRAGRYLHRPCWIPLRHS